MKYSLAVSSDVLNIAIMTVGYLCNVNYYCSEILWLQ